MPTFSHCHTTAVARWRGTPASRIRPRLPSPPSPDAAALCEHLQDEIYRPDRLDVPHGGASSRSGTAVSDPPLRHQPGSSPPADVGSGGGSADCDPTPTAKKKGGRSVL
jgi:hypothetical protein